MSYCTNQGPGWRLPSVTELQTIVRLHEEPTRDRRDRVSEHIIGAVLDVLERP